MRSDPYRQENLRRGAFHYLIGRGAAGAAGFMTVLLLVRFMDVENYAAYTALSGLIALCGVVAGLGMERVIARYVPEARIYCAVKDLKRFIWITAGIRLVTSALVVTLLYVLWQYIDKFLSATQFAEFPYILAAVIISETLFQHFSVVLQSLVMQKALTRLMVIQWAGRLTLIILVVYLQGNLDWRETLWVFAIPEILGVIGFIIVINLQLKKLSAEHHETAIKVWPQWDKVVEVGLHNYGFTLLAAPPQGYFMKLMTAAYLPTETVAAYGFFLSIAEKARQYIPLHFFYGMLEPIMVARYLKDRDFSALRYHCQLLYKSNLILMVPIIAWVAASGAPIVDVIAPGKFSGLSWILILVLVQLTIGSHVVLLQLILNSLEKSNVLLSASLVALPTMAVAMIGSIHINATGLLYTPLIFSAAMNFYIIKNLSRSNYQYKNPAKMLGGVILSGIVTFAIVGASTLAIPNNTSPLITAAFTLTFAAFVYSMTIWISNTVRPSELNLIRSLIKK